MMINCDVPASNNGTGVSNISSNHSHDLSQPVYSSAGSSHDEYELQSLQNEGHPNHHESINSRQSPSPSLPDTLVPHSQRTSFLVPSHEELRSSHRATNFEYQSTIRHGDGSQESLLEGQENLALRYRSGANPHRTDSIIDSPTTHLAIPSSTSLKSQSISRKYSAHRYWAWEISASILSIACIASIVGVLLHEQNKPLRQWGLGQMHFSPNVVVSLLGTLGKSACLVAVAEIVSQLKWMHYQNKTQKLSDLQLFDDASRGPWGALQLVIGRNKKTLLATCASIITIASLPIDPFIQSVFSFPSIFTPIQGQIPTILSSQSYGVSPDQGQDTCSAYSLAPRMALKSAVLRPIYNATKEPYLPCNFERCEWPTITTLGVCSNCIDLTNTITSTCDYIVTSKQERIILYRRKLQCNYTLPGVKGEPGTLTMVQASFSSAEIISDGITLFNQSTIWNSTSVQWDPTRNQSLVNEFIFAQFDPVMNFGEYIPGGWDTLHNLTGITGPPAKRAGHCTMQLCAKTFETPYYENFTTSDLTGPHVGLSASGNDGTYPLVPFNFTPESETTMTKDKIFLFSFCDWQALFGFLYDLFLASLDTFENEVHRTYDVPLIGAFLSKVDNITVLVDQIADSLTEEFRTSADSFSTNGVGMNSEVFIVINWAWLALPISVTVLTFVLLIVVIITNHARGMPPWRSSNLALLFHEVDGWDSSQMVVGGPEDMKARAKEMTAQITYEQDLLLFSKAE